VSWQTKSLKEISVNFDSKRVPITKGNRELGEIPYYGASGIVDYVKDYIFDGDYLLVSEDGANLLDRNYPIAFTANGKFWVNNHAHILKFNEKITHNFVEYFLNSISLVPFVSGMAQPKLNQAMLNKIQIPFPPLLIQKKIVDKLDAIFSEIDKATMASEVNAKNAESLFQSYLTQVFEKDSNGWDIKFLNQISENLDSKRIPITKGIREEGVIPYYGASGIVDYVKNFIFDGDILLISEDGANLLARTYPIAFSVNGKCWVNNHAHVVKFQNLVSQIFVEFYLNSISLKPFVSGMAQPKLNQAMLNKIPIPFPSLEEQAKLVNLFESIKESSDISHKAYIRKIEELSKLKSSILKQAFNGELVKE
jgi:type I restriction enzyme, S subunit